jgi:hypothetical protein
MAIRNHDIFHRWAYRNDNSRRQGNVSYNGECLLSYNTVIARHINGTRGRQAVLLTLTSYSSTTAGHISAAWRAVPDGVRVIRYRGGSRGGSRGTSMKPTSDEIVADHVQRMGDLAVALARSTKRKMPERLAALADLILEADSVAEFLGVPYPDIPQYRAMATDSEVLETFRRDAAANRKVELQAEREEEAKRLEKYADEIQRWRAGFAGYLSFSPKSDLLRLVGDFVETSRSIRVPVAEVRRHLRRVVEIIASGGTWRSNGDRMEVGGFNLTEIAGGFVRIGCHRFEYSEVQALAAVLDGSTLYERATGGV